ncbi:MAG TPA: PilZ domain-containing protein [Nitrospira sp.]|nr:PilZ domain-containing protein [Nitrospira sp.]
MQERKFERFNINAPVTFAGDTIRGEGRIENLSLGGAAIASDVSVSRGEYLKLSLTLPEQRTPIEVELAPIRWVKDRTFGVEFIRMSTEALHTLRRYIERLESVPDQTVPSNR